MFKDLRKECPKYIYDSIQYREDRLVYSICGGTVGQPMPTFQKLAAGLKDPS